MTPTEIRLYIDAMVQRVHKVEHYDRVKPEGRGRPITVYIGLKQYNILRADGAKYMSAYDLERGDAKFLGWPIVKVLKDDYFAVHLGGEFYGKR